MTPSQPAKPTHLVAATLTPLTEDDQLHREGLEHHLNTVWDAQIPGVLIGGTMGLMQLQRDQTWRDLVTLGAQISKGRGEVFLGVGETSTGRTLDRLAVTNELQAHAVVVLTPYMVKFSDAALVEHFRAVARASRHPVYLYDLPGLTGRPLNRSILEALTDEPNLAGIKCSGPPDLAVELVANLGQRYRVLISQPTAADVFLRSGYHDQLDGIYAVAPRWSAQLAREADAGDWDAAAKTQAKISRLLYLVRRDPFPVCSVLWRLAGTPGGILPSPMAGPSDQAAAELEREPIVQDWLATG